MIQFLESLKAQCSLHADRRFGSQQAHVRANLVLQQFAIWKSLSSRRRLDSSAGISKAAANLSAGSLERTRLRCSSMSSRIVIAFRTHGNTPELSQSSGKSGRVTKDFGGRRALLGLRGRGFSLHTGMAGTKFRSARSNVVGAGA